MASGMIKTQVRIGGMTCMNCQNRIEQKLRNTAGIIKVSVSYRTGLAEITYDPDLISEKDIAAIIERMDYAVLPDREPEEPNLTRTVCFLAIIVSLYVLLEGLGILNLLVPSRLADSTMGYGMLFVVGLVTSVHCVAMCGGINLSQCVPRGGSQDGDCGGLAVLRPALLYNLGRVISYTGIGFLLGLAGLLLGGGSGTGPSVLLQGILKLAAGAVMVVMGINMLGLFPWLRKLTPILPRFCSEKAGGRRAGSGRPLTVGLLNGLMPCGPLQSMQILALASGNPASGALSMLLFGLGTVPLMLGLGSLVSALGRRFTKAVMSVGAVLVTVLGLAMLSQGGSLSGLLLPERMFRLLIALCVLAAAASVPCRRPVLRTAGLLAVCAAALVFTAGGGIGGTPDGGSADAFVDSAVLMENNVQVVNSTLKPGQYPTISVQAGIPVKWVINAPEGSVNGCNYKLLLSEYGIEHVFQEGENVLTFTPSETGVFQYSCWMGMIRGSVYVTDGQTDAVTAAAPSTGWSCCGGILY